MCTLILVTGAVYAQTGIEKYPNLSLSVNPGYVSPVEFDSAYFTNGWDTALNTELHMPFWHPLFFGAGLAYTQNRVQTTFFDPKPVMTIVSLGASCGVTFKLTDRLGISPYLAGGLYFPWLPDQEVGLDPVNIFFPFSAAGVRGEYRLGERLSVYLDGSLYSYTGLMDSLRLSFGSTVHLSFMRPKEPLKLFEIHIGTLFPVFFKFYNDHPIGSARIFNGTDSPIQNIEISFFANQYMDNPQLCEAPETLEPQEGAEIDVFGLFTPEVMKIAESMNTQSIIRLAYTYRNRDYVQEYVGDVKFYDKNAMVWDDDRKAAAFVTALDQTVLKFAKNSFAALGASTGRGLDPHLLKAITVFNALSIYGISYIPDPTIPFGKLDQTMIDFLQFPRQTLEYRGGDCDDLSVLFTSLLESISVEAAFITVPGHIYTAFALDGDSTKAVSEYGKTLEPIIYNDQAWIPVETTLLDQGFEKAMQAGMDQWKRYSAEGKAALLPVHSCWETYEPVGFSSGMAAIAFPDPALIRSSVQETTVRYAERQIMELERELLTDSSVRGANKLGILYARYGLDARAEEAFNRALSSGEYLPALINLANLYYLETKYSGALGLYDRAYATRRTRPSVILGLVKTHYALDDTRRAKEYLDILTEIDKELADHYAFIGTPDTSDDQSRAADMEKLSGDILWEE